MIAARKPVDFNAWPYNVKPVITSIETRLEGLAHIPAHVRELLGMYMNPDRVIGPPFTAELREAARTLDSTAQDFGALAQATLDAMTEGERAEIWGAVKRARKAEAQQQEGMTA